MLVPFVLAMAMTAPPQALTGQALLNDLSKRSVQFFWDHSHPLTGFTRDRAANEGTQGPNNVSSIAATGYALASYAIGSQRKWLDRDLARKRAIVTVTNVLQKHSGKNGWYYHFVDWSTGARVWNSEVSSIDSAIFFAGLSMAERGFADEKLTKLTNQVFAKIDWNWMLTDGGTKPTSLSFNHGWKPEGFLAHRWSSFCEMGFLYILAYANWPAMPQGAWNAWGRPEVTYNGVNLLVGGPLFMHQMTQGFYDLKYYRDQLGFDYWVEGRNATLANRQYCLNNPQGFAGYGSNIWGLSACDIPTGYGAQGAPGWINDNGTLAPAAAVASVIYAKTLCTRAGEAFLQNYPASYGRYGFTTGINPSQNWRSPDVIGIDLGQMMLNIEIARDGLPYKYMMGNPKTTAAYTKIGLVKTEEGLAEARPLKLLN